MRCDCVAHGFFRLGLLYLRAPPAIEIDLAAAVTSAEKRCSASSGV